MPTLNPAELVTQAVAKARQYAERGSAELHYVRKMLEAGALKLESPQAMAAMAADIARWGEIGMIPSVNARRTPHRVAVHDDEGSMTFRELDDAVNAVANRMVEMGVKGGDGVAILARNHRWFLVANYACARVGARTILLNTEFSGPQISDVADREGARLLIYDAEYSKPVSEANFELGKLRAHAETADGDDALADVVKHGNKEPAPKPSKHASLIILTSGTTGTPKGANRSAPPTLAPIGGVLSHVPFKAGEVTDLPSPMFHALGYLHATLAMALGSTLILRRKFRPLTVVEDIEKYRATALVVVPVMLSRILDALDSAERSYDLTSLRIVFVSGSQLGGELATRATKRLGPVIYNLYGSTEIAFATIARPKDLEINPSTVGPIVKGAKVKILDEHGKEVPQGEVGRIFVGNFFPFEGYTGGGGKQIIDGLLSSGDMGYFDDNGLLYVTGRDDEMIVSGGENVFPAEVEDLISGHPEVVEATALGVEDKEYGARLRAFVVKQKDSSIGEDEIKSYVKEHLARYKVPREVIFLDELPRNPTGKILKRELRKIDAD
ncbi:MAG TPA: long-chain-fatty-acid--CoA ligase FadD2 [Mycobacterium sp.]|nr:long-chain-fatty-acid--CoA ligase FadD2 [Mycobacterium sp.]